MNDYIAFLRKHVGRKPVILCGAGVIILNDNKELLMIHRVDNGLWAIPGGAIELGEHVEEAARRELFEETGLKVKELKLFGVYSGPEMYYKYPNGDEVYFVGTVYEGLNYYGDIKSDNLESDIVKFFPINKIPQNLNPPDKVVIEDYINKNFN